MTYKRRKYHDGDTHLKKRWRLRNRKKDLDQIDRDLEPGNKDKLLNQEEDIERTGGAQFYCLHCARYFIDQTALNDHFRTKVHKRRLKALEVEPYTVEDSERAAGHGNFISPKKRKIETIVKDTDSKNEDKDGDATMKEDENNIRLAAAL